MAEAKRRTVDVHAHLLPSFAAEGFTAQALPDALFDPRIQLEDMDRVGIDWRVVCPPPFSFRYGAEDLDYYRRLNDGLAELIARIDHGKRFAALGAVPLHDPDAAAGELERVTGSLGFRGATIGTAAGERNLDDAALEPFWSAAEETRAVLLLHPAEVPGAERMGSYHLRNLVGNPAATALAAAQLIFGGVMDRHPNLRIILSHGGGALPWIAGRLDHGFEVRPECRSATEQRPSHQLRRFYYDTIVFDAPARQWLKERVGPGRLLYGTDAPFDMSDMAGSEAADHRMAAALLRLEA